MVIQPVSLAQHVREGVIAAINALNEVIGIVNNRPVIYTGRAAFSSNLAANSHMDFRVDFPEGTFTRAPHVVVTLYSLSTQAKFGSIYISIMEETTTYFTCRVFNASDTQFLPQLRYVAIQP